MDQGGHFRLLIGPKNTNVVGDVEILLPVKFLRILFGGFRREVENVLANHRPGGHLVFPIGQKNTNLVGRRDLAFCQCSLNYVQRFQSRSGKGLSKLEAGRPSCFFFDWHKNTNLVEDVKILLPVKFR